VCDDHDGAVLRSVYPTFEDIPETVKEAHSLSAEDRRTLPDDVFALVLLNNGESLRKYACIDEGSTVLSVAYFMKTAHKLPAEAQKTAAENLVTACGWYGLESPEPLQKIALGLGTALTALTVPSVIKGTHASIKNNLSNVNALEGAGAGVVTPNMMKGAEASGTELMPNQPPSDPSVKPSKTVVLKTAFIKERVGKYMKGALADALKEAPEAIRHAPASGITGHGLAAGAALAGGGIAAGHAMGGHKQAEQLAVTQPLLQEQPKKLPQAGQLHPTVDVTNATPPKYVTEKKANLFAVPSQSKYPLDDYKQVQAASAYFDEYSNRMEPGMRHEFAVNFMKRASALGLKVDNQDLKKYGSEGFAPEAEIKAAFDIRRLEFVNNNDALTLLGEVEKVARTRIWRDADTVHDMAPEEVCALVAEFDKVAGLDHRYDKDIPDPYYSIYGFDKTAEDESAWSDQIGNDMVTSEDLKRLAQIGAFGVKTTFGADFQEEYLKDPVGMYKSLPRTQKKMLIRMANSTQPGVERTY
jgi:hypothetical protein